MPLKNLNSEQFEAATANYGNNLIIASAGTGKTSTIVARIANLLNRGVKPEEILLLTFTNKASIEMIERVSKYYDKSITNRIMSGTFHSVSYKLLKAHRKIILKHPKELKVLLNSLLEKRDFPIHTTNATPYQASYLYDSYSLYQNRYPNESFGEWLSAKMPEQEDFVDIYEDVLAEFDELKSQFNYIDFNDLLVKMKDFLSQKSFGFSEILVDEYQDTNPLQNALIDAFKAPSLFCVGDYDQSIYGFNGSDINIIGSFTTIYNKSRVFSLNKNYRSSRDILALANRVIEINDRIYPKRLEVTREGHFPKPRLLIYDELDNQYLGIAKKIKASTSLNEDIAIIFRNNSSADGIEANLRELRIKAKRKGGISFFDAKEVKVILDIVTIMHNHKDMMAFIHILEFARGVGGVFAKDIFDILFKLGAGNIVKGLLKPLDIKNPFKKKTNFQLGLFDECLEFGSISKFKHLEFEEGFLSNPLLKHPKMNENLATYLYSLYKLLKNSHRISRPATILLNVINSPLFVKITDVISRERAKLKDGTVDKKLQKEKRENIQRKALLLHKLATNYKDINRFLNAMILGSNELTEGEGVNLLSIHASKGLEFKEVYIIDLMDGRFPNRKLMSKGGSLEEERRLFYVATTRAKDILYLSFAKYDRIKKINYLPSPFLKEAKMIK